MEEYIEESYDDNFIENPECDELIEEEMIELEEDIYEISDNEEDEEDFKHEDDFYVE